MVLVVRFPVSEDGVSWELDPELGSSLPRGKDLRVAVDEGREQPRLSSFLPGRFLVEESDLQVRVGSKKELGVLVLLLGELGVPLHGDDELELPPRHPLELSFELVGVSSEELDDLRVFDSVEKLDGLGVVHEAGDGSVEGLSSKGGPDSGSQGVLGGCRLESDGVEGDVVDGLGLLLVGLRKMERLRFLGEDFL